MEMAIHEKYVLSIEEASLYVYIVIISGRKGPFIGKKFPDGYFRQNNLPHIYHG